MSSLGDQIRSQAPDNAHFFQLSILTADRTLRTIPTQGLFSMNAALPELAPGRYSVLYYDRGTARLSKPVMVEVHAGMPEDQLMQLYEQEKRAASEAASQPGAPPEGGEADDAGGENDSQPAEAAMEAAGLSQKGYARMTRLRLEVERETQGIIAQAAHTREVGETHQLNGIMRREFVELHRHITANAVAQLEAVKHERSDFLRQRQEFDEVLGKIRSRYDDRIAQLPTAPPQPRDYSPELCKLIDLAQNIGLAVIQKGDGTPRGKSKRLPPSSGQLSEGHEAASTPGSRQPPEVPEAASPAEVPPVPAGDPGLLARVRKAMVNMSEAQLSVFLSNPAAALQALDELTGESDR